MSFQMTVENSTIFVICINDIDQSWVVMDIGVHVHVTVPNTQKIFLHGYLFGGQFLG